MPESPFSREPDHASADGPVSVTRKERKKIAIAGASGFIGTELRKILGEQGHEVWSLVRRAPKDGEIRWDPLRGEIDSEKLARVDAVVNLAGDSVATGRWSAAKKARILGSRVESTNLLARTLATLPTPPGVFVSCSASGYYGDAGAEPLSEDAPPGTDFLAEVCQAWERAAEPARVAGIRVVHPRIGVVLGAKGGPLPEMALPFRLGVGGRWGSGRQIFPWVALGDVVRALCHLLLVDSLHGPFNVCAPGAVTNAELTRTLAKVLHRPAWFPVPGFALRLVLGGFSSQLLSGQRPVPSRLEQTGFRFQFPELEAALRHELAR